MAKDSPRRKTKGADRQKGPTASQTDVKIEIKESKESKLSNSRNSVHHKTLKKDSRKKSVKSQRKSTKEEPKKSEKKLNKTENEHLEKENKSRRETLKTVDLDDREFTYEKDDIISEAAQQLLAERDKVNLHRS